jgi:hypothetical protein
VRTLRQIYQDYESNIDPDLLRFLGRLPRDRQRRLLLLLEGMETIVVPGEGKNGDAGELAADRESDDGRRISGHRLGDSVRPSRVRG